AVGRQRHVGLRLVAGGEGVGLELVAQRRAGGAVLPGVHAPAGAVLAVALPDDDEVAARIHGHAGEMLVASRGRVDLELVAARRAVRGEAAGEDAPAIAILTVTRPGDHEVAQRIHRHARIRLLPGGVALDGELAAEGAAVGGIALAINTPAEVRGVAGPDD